MCEREIPLEMCVTSNVHTGTVREASQHPLKRYHRAGCRVTLNTDSRLMDGITLSDEYWLAHETLGLTREDLDRVILNAAQSAFLPDAEKRGLVGRIESELRGLR